MGGGRIRKKRFRQGRSQKRSSAASPFSISREKDHAKKARRLENWGRLTDAAG